MITIEFACPDALLHIDCPVGNRELHDRINAALTVHGIEHDDHSVLWDPRVRFSRYNFDLAVAAAWYATDRGLLDRLDRFRGWTCAGSLSLDGSATGGVLSDGISAWTVADVSDLVNLLDLMAADSEVAS